MASFLSTSDIATLTGVLGSHFDTFNVQITIHKEPQKVLSNINSNHYAGYGYQSIEKNYTLVPVSSTFQAVMVSANKSKNDSTVESLNTTIPKNGAKIKVKDDAHNYIQNGKTELIELNGKKYNLISHDGAQNFLGLIYHIYLLEQTT